MNQEERQKRFWTIKDVVQRSGKSIWDFKGVSIHGDNYRHFMVKSSIYKILSSDHDWVFTEVEFPNGRIADVLDAYHGYVYEVETGKNESAVKEKLGNFYEYDGIQDVIVLDPESLSEDVFEMRSDLKDHLII